MFRKTQRWSLGSCRALRGRGLGWILRALVGSVRGMAPWVTAVIRKGCGAGLHGKE